MNNTNISKPPYSPALLKPGRHREKAEDNAVDRYYNLKFFFFLLLRIFYFCNSLFCGIFFFHCYELSSSSVFLFLSCSLSLRSIRVTTFDNSTPETFFTTHTPEYKSTLVYKVDQGEQHMIPHIYTQLLNIC